MKAIHVLCFYVSFQLWQKILESGRLTGNYSKQQCQQIPKLLKWTDCVIRLIWFELNMNMLNISYKPEFVNHICTYRPFFFASVLYCSSSSNSRVFWAQVITSSWSWTVCAKCVSLVSVWRWTIGSVQLHSEAIFSNCRDLYVKILPRSIMTAIIASTTQSNLCWSSCHCQLLPEHLASAMPRIMQGSCCPPAAEHWTALIYTHYFS